MRDVLDDDLAELYSVRSADDVRLARLREQLFAEPPVRRSRRWVGIAAAAAAVVLITGLVVTLRPVSRDAPATLPTKPATSLLEAAALLETAPKPTARYQHIKYSAWQTFATYNGATALEFEISVWLPTAPDEMVVVYRRFTGGYRTVAGAQQKPEELLPDGYRGPQLWGSFCAATPCKEESVAQPLRPDPALKLEDATTPIVSPFTTNEERAALYRRLAESPEIHWDNGKVSADGGRVQFTIDPATGRLSGFEERKPTKENRLPGGLVTMSATITYEWVDQRPQ